MPAATGAGGLAVVGLGQACLDLLGRVAQYPEVDRKVELEEVLIQGGGPVATALLALARLGFFSFFAWTFGDTDPA